MAIDMTVATQSEVQTRPARPATFVRHGLPPAILAAVLLWLCFFPMSLGWLVWVSLMPLLCLVRSTLRPRTIYLCAWLSGLLFYWVVLQWMRVADFRMYYTWAMLATYCSVYFPVAVFLIRRIDLHTPVPLMVSVPCVWVGLEFVRSFLLTGFAWYYLGHTQHDYLVMIQIADITGVYGISFLVAAVNALLFTLLCRSDWCRRTLALRERPEGRLAAQGFVLLLLLAATVTYGMQRLEESDFSAGPRVALLQGNLDQRLRNDAFSKQQEGGKEREREEPEIVKINRHYAQLCLLALTRQYVRPDLIVWPETSFPVQWFELSEKLDPVQFPEEAQAAIKSQDIIRQMALAFNNPTDGTPTSILLGVNTAVMNQQQKIVLYNAALLVDPTGSWGPRYDKIHRIPFGEYVPLRDWLPFMKEFMPYDFEYSITSGEKHTRFTLGKHSFGVLICYEDTDPYLARHYGRAEADGPAVDFLLNISNDGWFDGTSEHDEHLAICRFRAIENRRSVARAVNMGISAVIDPNGHVLRPERIEQIPFDGPANAKVSEGVMNNWLLDARAGTNDLATGEWHEHKKSAGVLTARIPIDNRTSYYAVLGDWLPWGCWLVVIAAVVWGMWAPSPSLQGGRET